LKRSSLVMCKRLINSLLFAAALGLTACVSTASADHGGSCDCPPGYKKECVPVQGTKSVTTRVYTDRCEDFCLPKCSFFGHHHHGDCGDGCTSCGKCGHVRSRKDLYVKLRKCDECEHKCEVQLVPCGSGGCCDGGAVIIQGQPMTEQAPMP